MNIKRKPRIIRTAVRNLLGELPFADGLFRRFIWSHIHFPEVEMRFLDSLEGGSIDIAIDVGAATGSYAWILNRKSRLVYCFEPGVRHSRQLESAAFGTGIRVVKAAVGNVCGIVKMYTPGSDSQALHSATLSSGNPIAHQDATEVREVRQVTLDSFVEDKVGQERSVDVVKVDVEGYELEVFEGARDLISRYHPLIFCEIEKRHNAHYMKIFELLRGAGYTSCIYRDGGFQVFDGDAIDGLQAQDALEVRLDGTYDPRKNQYVNNFVFQHERTRIKVIER